MSDFFFLHNSKLEQLKFIPLKVVSPQLHTVVLTFVQALFIHAKKLFPASVWMAI